MSRPYILLKLGRHWIIFEVITEEPFTEEMAKMEQKRLGYDVRGYGFYDFNFNKRRDEYTWRCSRSSD